MDGVRPEAQGASVISTRSREASRHRARESFAHEGPPAVKGQNMAELVVVGFDNPTEADRALMELARLQKEYLIDLEDAVVAIPQPDGKVNLKQSINLAGVGAASGGLSGAICGSLVGLLFLNPLAGFAVGGLIGA